MPTSDLVVSDLRATTAKLLDSIEERFGAVVHLEDDLYWNVPLDAATAVYTAPELDPRLGCGRRRIGQGVRIATDEYVSIWHECDHLAGVLRAIARLDLPPAHT